jgi:prophage antirepressor-like protein
VSAEVVPFDFKGQLVRTILIDGEPHWVAADVTPILGYQHSPSAIRRLAADEHRQVPYALVDSTVRPPTGGYGMMSGPQTVTVVSEPGMYNLILGSEKPEAQEFKRWLTHEVLPSIRRHGAYLTPAKVEEFLSDPDTLIRLAEALKAERAERRRVEAQAAEAVHQLEAAEPKARAWEAFMRADGSLSISDAAKALNRVAGVGTGPRRLVAWMIDHHWVFRGGDGDLRPRADRIDCGHLEVKVYPQRYDERTGEPFLPTPQVRVTARGLDLLAKRLASHLGVAA